MTPVWVALGAAIGALLRFLIDRAIQARHQTRFPWGTFAVNVIGSFVLGGLTAAADTLPAVVSFGIGVGVCGALTTYSTFSHETLKLVEAKAFATGLANLAGSVITTLAAATLGWLIGQAFIR